MGQTDEFGEEPRNDAARIDQERLHEQPTITPAAPFADVQPTVSSDADSSSPAASPMVDHAAPARFGRFKVTAELGSGGFGTVYKAHDPELKRDVAIKVPHRYRIAKPEDAEAFLSEARILASLDHPHIVPVHDVGRTDDGHCYVVSKFIEGPNLGARMREARPAHAESADLVATVAEALHYAHRKGLVHRDIKPGNILIGPAAKPYIVDFGLALTEEDFGKGSGHAGTPAYMSPEQARGEGHRVDGRSDIFSLGVVFYELLTGRRPFRGDTPLEVLIAIIELDPRPLRQWDDTIPKEFDRICLKALAKRANDRYSTAKDLADDLRHFLAEVEQLNRLAVEPVPPAPDGLATVQPFNRSTVQPASPAVAAAQTPAATPPPTPPPPLRPTACQSRLSPRAFVRSTRTTPTFSWSCCPARAIATDCRNRSASGKRASKRPPPTPRSRSASSTVRPAAASRRS